MSKRVKLISIFSYSILLFLIFTVNFEPFDFAFLFSIQSVLYVVFLIFVYTLSISAISFLTVSRGFSANSSSTYIFLAIVLIIGTLTLYRDFANSFYTSIVLIFPFVIIFFTNNKLKRIYAITPIMASVQKAYKISSIFISLSLALSFYFYSNINSENPGLSLLVDKSIKKTTEVSLNLTGQATKIQIDRQVEKLSDEEKIVYEQNKQMLDSLFTSYGDQIFDTGKSIITDPVVEQTIEQIKSTTLGMLDKYEEQITLIGSFGVFGFAQFIFTLSSFVLVPLNYFVFKLFVHAGFFDKIKEKIEVEKYLV